MPASASRRRAPEPAPPRRRAGLWIGVAIIAFAALAGAFLPAAFALQWLAPEVGVGESSGTIWHGAANDVLVRGRRAGAFEWTLHPAPLLKGQLALGIRWVLGGMLVEGEANLTGHQLRLAAVRGGGPLADLADLGMAANWNGELEIAIDEMSATYARDPWRITASSAARGALRLRNVAAKPSGPKLGDYALEFPPGAAAGDTLSATLRDLGGPLEARGTLRLDLAERRLLLAGHARERPGAPPDIVNELKKVAQLSGRDAAGRIPFDIEINF